MECVGTPKENESAGKERGWRQGRGAPYQVEWVYVIVIVRWPLDTGDRGFVFVENKQDLFEASGESNGAEPQRSGG